MSITIGQNELAGVMKALGYVNCDARARNIIDTAQRRREQVKAEVPALPSWAKSPVEFITQAELADALTRLRYTGGVHADQIFENVKANREPNWPPGTVVKDAGGRVWYLNGAWFRPGIAQAYKYTDLRQPLTRLTEEK